MSRTGLEEDLRTVEVPVRAERRSRRHAADPARPDRLRLLDGLRLLAALTVLAYHFTARDSYAWGQRPSRLFPGLSQVTQYGNLGVNLFFIISGFVILMTAWGRPVDKFATSRITRLFPAYWAGVLLTGGLLLLVRPEGGLHGWEAITNLTMAQSALDVDHVDGVYWTLWVELRFYLLIGLLLAVGLTRRRVIGLIVFWPMLAALVHTTDQAFLSSLLIWNYAPYFAAGMALFLIYREGASVFHWLLVAYNWAIIVGLTGRYFPSGVDKKTHHQASLWVTLIVITVSILLVAACTSRVARRVQWRWLTTAGALTYPLYLLHEHWGWFFISHIRHWVSPVVTLVVVTAACLLMAWLIHRWVERPLAPRLKTWVARGLADARS
ncbi:acyltransferase [Terrabacter sp. NPDC080008]|uniref:acyltransferase family protein n=1 Tax=Terrabacter sp. NPDC080008 TaxID=3155176 RepID=UPI00344FFD58